VAQVVERLQSKYKALSSSIKSTYEDVYRLMQIPCHSTEESSAPVDLGILWRFVMASVNVLQRPMCLGPQNGATRRWWNLLKMGLVGSR
jgi:hypothetical protein